MTADGGDRSFGAPRFDVVLRGYDRRQVDEHLSRLQRLMGRMRSDLDAARVQQAPPIGPPTPAGGRPRPTPRPRPDGSPPTGGNDVVGTFTDRMHAILQAAEEEAAEIRNKARTAARADEEWAAALRAATHAEEETARKTVADLVRQRDAVLAELTRVRGQLEGLLSGPTTRITLPTQESRPDRREVGAGQPLPGTPHSPEPVPVSEPVAVTVGPPSAPHDAVGPAARTATGTAVFAVPFGAGEASSDEPAAERTTPVVPAAVSPAEETAVMEPLTDEPDESASVESGAVESDAVEPGPVEPGPVESAHAEESSARAAGEGGGAADHEPDADEPDDDPGPPTDVPAPLHSSQAR
jgi:hypothetical protein